MRPGRFMNCPYTIKSLFLAIITPMTSHKKNRVFITLFIAFFLVTGSVTAIYFARGYRPNLKGGLIEGTGLLSATSYPKAAQIFINGKLTSATDTTINLLPNEYDVKITKEGFLPWEKHLNIQTELVTITDARLFPAVPSLTALTYSGSLDPQVSPDGKKIAYFVNGTNTEDKKGLYVTDINSSNILGKTTQQITKTHPTYSHEDATLLWSPDSKQILLVFFEAKNKTLEAAYLLDANNTNNFTASTDVTVRLSTIISTWEQQITQDELSLIKLLPDYFADLATSFTIYNLYFSPDQEKFVYTTKNDLTLPETLKDQLVSINSTPQDRNLKANHIYVYDLKEDTNYHLGVAAKQNVSKLYLAPPEATSSATPSDSEITGKPAEIVYNQLQKDYTLNETINLFKTHYSPLYTATPSWYQTSRHLITTENNQVTIFEYDNTNHSVVYSGPFNPNFVVSSSGGDRLILLTNLNQNDAPTNLYSLDLK